MCSQCKRHTQSIQADNSDVSRDKKKKKEKEIDMLVLLMEQR